MTDPLRWSLCEAADAIAAKQISAAELTTLCLDRAKALQPVLNAFVEIEEEAALAQAAKADAADGSGGRLHGVPMAHKDMYYRERVLSGCGSAIRRDFVPKVTSTALRLMEGAGAIHLGRLNMSEFAANPTGHNDHVGDACNPWNADHATGGSSSGSGVAVASRMAFAALGSDTGGSIRIPAALCGTSGLKATYGRVSRFGAMPLSQSMDHVGPLSVTARDCARILSVIGAPDPADATTRPRPVEDLEAGIGDGVRGLRIGMATGAFAEGLDGEVEAARDGMRKVLEGLGATVVETAPPLFEECNSLGFVLARSEGAAIHAAWLEQRVADYGPAIRRMMTIGLGLPAAAYTTALNLRGPILRQFTADVFGEIDVLFAPSVPIASPRRDVSGFGGPEHVPAAVALSRLTRPFNYLGLPALSVPAGFSAAGLPLSMQIVGRPYDEGLVCRVGHAFQEETDWHARVPPTVGALAA